MGEATIGEGRGTVTRSAEYVGSFPVSDSCLDEQIVLLYKQLMSLRTCKRRRPVSLKFSVKGVKMYDEDETTLLMAHALRRVSLSTARPSDTQFAFVSHNPGSLDAQLYCHLFKARHARAAQFLNLLLCRCFQLFYLEKHPDEAQEEPVGPGPRPQPSLLNHGFPLSVSALVSFRRAPFAGLLPGAKVKSNSHADQLSIKDEVLSSSPSLMRKRVIRTKLLQSGAYRSFTFSPFKQHSVQEHLSSPKAVKEVDKQHAKRPRAPSLAETEEAMAQAVWCWAGIATDSSSSLLAEDVLGSFLLCQHPKKPNCGSIIIRFPSGLIPFLIENPLKGTFSLEKSKTEFTSMAALIEHYTEHQDGLACPLSCARVNHCYEWEEKAWPLKDTDMLKSPRKNLAKTSQRKQWV